MLGQGGKSRSAGGAGDIAPGVDQVCILDTARGFEIVQVENRGQEVGGIGINGATGGEARFGAEVGAAGTQIVEFIHVQGMGAGGFHEAGSDDGPAS